MTDLPGRGTVAVLKTTPPTILDDIARLMDLGGVSQALPRGVTTGLKINISWQTWYPACSTTPWQLEGVIRALQGGRLPRPGGRPQRHRGGRYLRWASSTTSTASSPTKYQVPCLYLYEQDFEWFEYRPKRPLLVLDKVYPDGVFIPKALVGMNMVHLPTVKTHVFTTITGAMKNAFGGLLHRHRHWTHAVIHDTLVDLLAIQQEIHPGLFAVMDGTFAGDGPGPRAMRWHEKDILLASADQVAIDAVSARLQGFDPMKIRFIRRAHEAGLGVGDPRQIEIVGYDIEQEPAWGFVQEDTFASRGQKLIYHGPLKPLEKPLLQSPLVPWSYFASNFYHNVYWYPFVGRQRVEAALHTRWGRLFRDYGDGQVVMPGMEPKTVIQAVVGLALVAATLLEGWLWSGAADESAAPRTAGRRSSRIPGSAGDRFHRRRARRQRGVAGLPLGPHPPGVGGTLFNYSLRFVKWHFYLRRIGADRISRRESARLFVAGFPLALTPGKLGEALKAVWVQAKTDIPTARALPVVAAERVSDGMAVLLLSSVGVVAYPQYWPAFALLWAVLLGIVAISQFDRVVRRGIDRWAHIPWLMRLARPLGELFVGARTLLGPRPLAVAVALGTVAWLGEGVGFFVILVGLGLPPTAETLAAGVFALAFSTAVGGASTLPGGSGRDRGFPDRHVDPAASNAAGSGPDRDPADPVRHPLVRGRPRTCRLDSFGRSAGPGRARRRLRLDGDDTCGTLSSIATPTARAIAWPTRVDCWRSATGEASIAWPSPTTTRSAGRWKRPPWILNSSSSGKKSRPPRANCSPTS